MKIIYAAMLAALLFLGGAFAPPAYAGPITINVSTSGSGISLQGVASATQVSPTAFHLDAFTGIQTLGPSIFHITGLSTFGNPDQLLVGQANNLMPGQQGFAFGTDTGGNFNVESPDGATVVEFIESLLLSTGDPNLFFQGVAFNAYVAPPKEVPEPFTLSLFGAGLAGAAAIRRRQKKAA